MGFIHISCGAVVYKIEKEKLMILVMYRKRSNTWHLPKGTRENNESLRQTALREIKEETGLEIKINSYLGGLDSIFRRDGKVINKKTHYFLARPVSGNILNHDKEHDKVIFLEYLKALECLENFSPYGEKEGKILRMFPERFGIV